MDESPGGCLSTPGEEVKATSLDNRFDGDEMNGTLLVDDYMAERFEAMAPYKSVMSTSTPRELGHAVSKTKPWISTVANFLEAAPSLPPDPVILQRMAMIPEAPPLRQ